MRVSVVRAGRKVQAFFRLAFLVYPNHGEVNNGNTQKETRSPGDRPRPFDHSQSARETY